MKTISNFSLPKCGIFPLFLSPIYLFPKSAIFSIFSFCLYGIFPLFLSYLSLPKICHFFHFFLSVCIFFFFRSFCREVVGEIVGEGGERVDHLFIFFKLLFTYYYYYYLFKIFPSLHYITLQKTLVSRVSNSCTNSRYFSLVSSSRSHVASSLWGFRHNTLTNEIPCCVALLLP